MAGFRACGYAHRVRRAFPSTVAWLALALFVGSPLGNKIGVACAENAIEARVETPFSCVGLPYGFYADPAHRCRVFHICNPQVINGDTVTRSFSYYCPGDKVFDQLHFSCLQPNASSPEACEEAEFYYSINEAFTLREAVLASRATKGGLSCQFIPTGTYADVRSGCRSYYVCTRITGIATAVRMSCPVPTVYDQPTKSCLYPDLATPCEQSEKYYNVPDFDSLQARGEPSPVLNLSPRGDLHLPYMPEYSVYQSPVGNKLLSSEVVMAGLGVRHTMAKHAVTASNGQRVLEAPASNFSCEGRQYGYYADEELCCEYFHVCTVKAGSEGQRVFEKHSFRCDDATVFDQEQFECRIPEEALPCSQAQANYGGNSVWNEW
ncbi:uncharacterized protein [Dermacentor andersoni]|uniref:uncharacterized protein n=1 Tax=Dermacentor andersoni TaxID=34620 RepID=UPI0021551D5B|nr:uncharacterized protein LOC126531158 [Dermacentor andersoni]